MIAKFDPKALAARTGEVRTVKDPDAIAVLGEEIKFGVISYGERLELDEIEDSMQKMKQTVYVMLHKAYPELTLDDVGRMEDVSVVYLFKVLTEASDFRASLLLKSSGPTKTPEGSV